jgi:cytochrome c biogenesis protein CcdA
MVIGVGIVLLVLGLILVTGAVDLPASWENRIDGSTLGWILVAVGVLSIILGLVINHQRTRAATTRVEERRDYIDDGRRYDNRP